MTLHAGQKAARLRCATNSSSTGIVTSTSTSSSSSFLPHQSSKAFDAANRTVDTEDLLAPSRNSHDGLLEEQSTPTQASPALVKKAKSGNGTKRKGNRRNTSSHSNNGASAQSFVFSGLDPVPISETEMKNIDWQQKGGDGDVSVSTTVSDIVSPSPSLIFVAQPSTKSKPKSKSGTSKGDVKSSTPTSSPKASTSKQQIATPEAQKSNAKASPSKYTLWFHFSKGGEATLDGGCPVPETKGEDIGKDKEIVIGDATKSKATKKKKKKAKAKASDGSPLIHEVKKKQEVASSPRKKKMPKSGKSAVKAVDNRADISKDGLSQDVKQGKAKENSSTPTTSDDRCVPLSVQKVKSITEISSYVKGVSAAHAHEETSKVNHADKVKCRKLTIEALSCIRPSSAHERRGSTETTYHTAAPTTPSWDSECNPSKLLDISSSPSSRTTTPLYSSTFPVEATQQFACNTFSSNNSLVSMTEDSVITTEETHTSTHSSPKMDLYNDHVIENIEGSPDKTLTVVGRGELRHYSSAVSISQCSREVSLHPLQLDTDSSSSDNLKTKENGMAQLERLQRTLHWRLISAGRGPQGLASDQNTCDEVNCSLSPNQSQLVQSQVSTSHVPFVKRSESVASPMTKIDQENRRASYSWVHLLPSLEEIHPRRSIERETTLRSLAWLGLEEYVAKRSKGLGTSNNGGSLVWITHTSYPRNSVLHRTKAAHIEPLLCSSAFWLRSTNKNILPSRGASTQSVADSIKAYQSYLQSRPSSISPNAVSKNKAGATLQKVETTPREHLQESNKIDAHMSVENVYDIARLPVPTIVCPNDSAMIQSTPQELQRYIEQSMFDLRCCHDSKKVMDEAWLHSLSSIATEEKDAIKGFLDGSNNEEWQGTEGDEMPSQSPLHGPTPPEVAWPTTPYTPVNLLTGLPDGINGAEEVEQLGLSAGEMEEIEEAMYRDYLSQVNQYPRSNRKKERYNDTHRIQGRSRAHSSSRMMQGSPSVSSIGRANTIDDVNRYMSGASTSANFPASQRQRSPIMSRGDGISRDSKGSCAMTRHNSSSDYAKYSDATQRCLAESISIGHSPFLQEQRECAISAATPNRSNSIDEQDVDWDKENANLAVQSSLANLQQHLALATRKQSNSSTTKMHRVSPLQSQSPYLSTGSYSERVYVSGPSSLHRSPKEQYRRPAPQVSTASKSPIFTSPTRQTEQSILQSELRMRQFQVSVEASMEARKLLEERHLLSYAQAVHRSRQQQQQQKEEEAKMSITPTLPIDEVNRVQAEIARECSRLGLSNSTVGTPLITLTEPSIQERRLKGNLKMNTRMSDLPWSDDPFSWREQMVTPRLSHSHQEAVDPFVSELQRSDGMTSASALSLFRRHSLQPFENVSSPVSPLHYRPTSSMDNTYFPHLDPQRSPHKIEKNANHSVAMKQRGKSGPNQAWRQTLAQQQQQSQSDQNNFSLLGRLGPIRTSAPTSATQ